ncbi:hypothetical protein ACRS99_000297 [Clostridium perfringens]|uniref:phosphoribosyltransferase-like protein n=1 Tax=Clostridium perfringens TaxID=1502 RepID=UPI002FCCEB8C|nr:hypothetical protein [Clostridium perfringens]MBS5968134.1 hypothetical protein [Clostridium perfringens]
MIERLLEIIEDYKMPEGTSMNKTHIERWINQFDVQDRGVILSEMVYILEKFYFSRNSIKQMLKNLFSCDDVWGKCTKNFFKNVSFLDIQIRGGSQVELLELASEVLSEEYQLDITECSSDNRYVYIDDCIFTGSRLKWDIQEAITSGKIKKNSELWIIHLCKYKSGSNYAYKEIGKICEKNNVNYYPVWFLEKQNYHKNEYGNSLDTLWPKYVNYEDLDDYIKFRKENSEWANKIDFFRNYNMKKENLFSCAKNREIVESAFLKAGATILKGINNPCESMRPMGFSKLESIGFGAMFVTYRNIANNCPLALWYGDIFNQGTGGVLGRWYPLFPRRCNEEVYESTFNFDNIF